MRMKTVIHYLACSLNTGRPLYFMELSFCQFALLGPITIWKINPLLKSTLAVCCVDGQRLEGHNEILSLTTDFLCSPKISGEHIVAALSVRPSVRTSHSCPAHNFVIWSRISKIFHRNDHHIVMTCRTQHLGRYLEGQGHSMTLHHNRVRSITSLFGVGFQN